jgi:hypothetical protein
LLRKDADKSLLEIAQTKRRPLNSNANLSMTMPIEVAFSLPELEPRSITTGTGSGVPI